MRCEAGSALPRGAWIGILGGGQLGRMLAAAAARLGYRVHVYDPAEAPPASVFAGQTTQAAFDDTTALEAFAASVDLITFEFENIPLEAVVALSRITPVFPDAKALEVSQDRLTEKTYLESIGLTPAPFRSVTERLHILSGLEALGGASILKTRRFGYDGKGQFRLEAASEASAAWEAIGAQPAVLEGIVPFTHEISVIGARNHAGQIACYDPACNTHEGGILRRSFVPAPLQRPLLMDAVLAAGKILRELEYVGVMGVEFFATPKGLIVNEIAPRVHNSGHWTQEGCVIDQFEQHIRAITGLPLGDGQRYADVEMINLIGDDLDDLPHHLANPQAAVHLYGKAEVRAGRKMGHVNIVQPKG